MAFFTIIHNYYCMGSVTKYYMFFFACVNIKYNFNGKGQKYSRALSQGQDVECNK